MVTAWVQDNGMHLYPNTDIGGKYNVLSNGELYINNASPTDGLKSYTCRTINRLTGKNDCMLLFKKQKIGSFKGKLHTFPNIAYLTISRNLSFKRQTPQSHII